MAALLSISMDFRLIVLNAQNIEKDAPALTQIMIDDGCDAAVLVPNCPVCYRQSVSIAARHLEENGMPTVIMGAARDIVMRARVPRLLFQTFL